MERRIFLKNASAAIVLAGAGMWACDSKSGKQKLEASVGSLDVQLAMGWLLWRDFKDKKISLKEALTDLHELGANGIEFNITDEALQKEGFTRESLKEYLKELNLKVSGHYFMGNYYDEEQHADITQRMQKAIESIKGYGGKNLVLGPPDIPQNGEDPMELIRKMGPFLNKLGKMALDQGVEIGIHPHLNSIVETPEEIDACMAETNPEFVFLSADTFHIHMGGGNVVETIRKYKDRINYFHFKDGAGTFERPHFFDNVRELGKGEIDFPGLLSLLKEINYKGWINIEQDFTTQTPRESAEQSLNFLKEKLQENQSV